MLGFLFLCQFSFLLLMMCVCVLCRLMADAVCDPDASPLPGPSPLPPSPAAVVDAADTAVVVAVAAAAAPAAVEALEPSSSVYLLSSASSSVLPQCQLIRCGDTEFAFCIPDGRLLPRATSVEELGIWNALMETTNEAHPPMAISNARGGLLGHMLVMDLVDVTGRKRRLTLPFRTEAFLTRTVTKTRRYGRSTVWICVCADLRGWSHTAIVRRGGGCNSMISMLWINPCAPRHLP
jgi:hypothetical protein